MVNTFTRSVKWSLPLLVALVGGCTDESSPIEVRYFTGNVYDGVKGDAVKKYRIWVEFNGRRYEGKVGPEGVFELEGVPVYNDYTVRIEAAGYRSFVSHNGQFVYSEDVPSSADVPGHLITGNRSFYYNAYLFSQDARVDDQTFTVQLDDTTDLPTASLRMRPTAISALYDDTYETPAGVPGQIWYNDNDLMAQSLWLDVQNGTVAVPGNSLVYGVAYQLVVLGVPGYQMLESGAGAWQAGIDGNRTLVLSRTNPDPLRVTYMSVQDGNPTPDGSLTLVFSRPIEFDPLSTQNYYLEQMDDAFSITSPDLDADGNTNILQLDMPPAAPLFLPPPDADDVQENGVAVTINGNIMTLSWDPKAGLGATDPQDPIRAVTYGALSTLRVRPADGGDARDVANVGALVGSGAVTVVVSP